MFRRQLNSKIGNLLCYLSTRISRLNMTKALKLLYLIDETAYMRTGVPVTWFDYKVWKNGPVAEELYNELRYDQKIVQGNQPLTLEDFIKTEKSKYNGNDVITILPVVEPDMGDFTEFELELIDNIVDRFGTYTASELIKLLHEKNTLWHKSVSENDLKLNFKVYGSKSNHVIDFSELIKDDRMLQMSAQSAFESMQMHEALNSL